VSAEKGYLRETGNLLFHLALVVLLAAIAMGGLWGYKGDVLVIEGSGFSNTPLAYDSLHPGRLFNPDTMAPFSFRLDDFAAGYLPNGQAKSFDARIDWRASPGAATKRYDVRENHPLVVDPTLFSGGVKLYLGGHGYAPHFVVRKPDGTVVFDDDVAFLPENANTYQSNGVVKVADDAPEQLAFEGFFTPTTVLTPNGIASSFPAPRNPAVTLTAYHGRLVDTGSVYSLDTALMKQYTQGGRPAAKTLSPGQTWKLPDGTSITFSGFKEFANFHVTYDPGKRLALLAASLMVVGLVLSLRVRRRRLWVRAVAAASGGRTVVEVGGLARSDTDRFAEEFDELVGELRGGVPVAPATPTTAAGAGRIEEE
jgi:cytochrome c biogenesis protein